MQKHLQKAIQKQVMDQAIQKQTSRTRDIQANPT